jgi:hypothetical protein
MTKSQKLFFIVNHTKQFVSLSFDFLLNSLEVFSGFICNLTRLKLIS